jgi:hypothetical protein
MLPIKIDLPTYDLVLPSSGKEIKVRPFLVKEEKLLLMATESQDEDDIVKTTKQIVQNCILDDVDVDKLPFFDVDYLIVALRAKSLGDKVEVRFVCQNVLENELSCNKSFYADVDISKAEIDYKEKVSPTIDLGKGLTVKMRYPTYSIMKMLDENDNELERKVKIIAVCVEQIIQGDKVYSHRDYSRDEMKQFIENMTEEQFLKLEKFVDNFPGFLVRLHAKCPGCGFDHNIEYKEFQSFFY